MVQSRKAAVKPELHMISDGTQSLKRFLEIVRFAAPYVDVVHVREKERSAREIAEWIEQLKRVIPPHKIAVNDRLDAALAGEINRVQLAWHSLPVDVVKRTFPPLTVGCSVHSPEEAVEMEKRGADYVLYGHVYPTGSKPGIPARGLDGLRQTCAAVTIPVIAIGGIRPENVADVLAAGAAGIAVMSGITQARDPAEAAQAYAKALNLKR